MEVYKGSHKKVVSDSPVRQINSSRSICYLKKEWLKIKRKEHKHNGAIAQVVNEATFMLPSRVFLVHTRVYYTVHNSRKNMWNLGSTVIHFLSSFVFFKMKIYFLAIKFKWDFLPHCSESVFFVLKFNTILNLSNPISSINLTQPWNLRKYLNVRAKNQVIVILDFRPICGFSNAVMLIDDFDPRFQASSKLVIVLCWQVIQCSSWQV